MREQHPSEPVTYQRRYADSARRRSYTLGYNPDWNWLFGPYSLSGTDGLNIRLANGQLVVARLRS